MVGVVLWNSITFIINGIQAGGLPGGPTQFNIDGISEQTRATASDKLVPYRRPASCAGSPRRLKAENKQKFEEENICVSLGWAL